MQAVFYVYDASMKDELYQTLSVNDLHPLQQMKMKNHLLERDVDFINRISNDSWRTILHFCRPKDVVSIGVTCEYFAWLTNHKQMKKYWKFLCDNLCSDIQMLQYKTKNWKQFFIALDKFLFKQSKFAKSWWVYKPRRSELELQQNTLLYPINIKTNCDGRGDTLKFATLAACEHDNVLIFQLLSRYFDNVNDICANSNDKNCYHTCDWPRKQKKNNKNNNSRKYITVLGSVIKNGSHTIAEYLLNTDFDDDDDNAYDDCNDYYSSHRRKIQNQLDIMQRFGKDLKTPLTVATEMLDDKILKLLLNHPKMYSKSMYTPLRQAIDAIGNRYITVNASRGLKVVSLLLDDKRIDVRKYEFQMAMHFYAKGNFPKNILFKLIYCSRVPVSQYHLHFAKTFIKDRDIISAIYRRIAK